MGEPVVPMFCLFSQEMMGWSNRLAAVHGWSNPNEITVDHTHHLELPGKCCSTRVSVPSIKKEAQVFPQVIVFRITIEIVSEAKESMNKFASAQSGWSG